MAAQMLVEEMHRRTDVAPGENDPRLIVARRDQVGKLVPAKERAVWRAWLTHAPAQESEAYAIVPLGPDLVIAGDDDRGVLYGVGYVLRKLSMSAGHARLDLTRAVYGVPDKALRLVQIGYRNKNNSYDAFTAAMFEQQVRDLAVFGASGIQWIAPVSDDDASSPHFHDTPDNMAVAVSKITAAYGLDFDLYYPEMAADYSAPGAVAAELTRFEALVKRLPHVDALFVPGGDPGHTAPDVLFPLVAKEVAILRHYHPEAKVWVSAQGFDRDGFERFYAQLAQRPDWLTGVFFGPQSRDGLEVERLRIPRRYKLLMYPDIAHILHAQFPVPQLDPVFALTEGREPVNPQPRAQSHIIAHFAKSYDGFVLYSEGVNDDVNKALWMSLAWKGTTPDQVMADYGRYFVGDTAFGQALSGLERNWDGPVRDNRGIAAHLRAVEAIHAPPQNWRYDMALYRAVYDRYVQLRAGAEDARFAAAVAALRQCDAARARTAFDLPDDAEVRGLRARLFDLAGKLYQSIGLQLSVKLYGASNWERGANLDRVDVSLNDRAWLLKRLDETGASCTALKQLADEAGTPAGLYDDLGDPTHEPHLVRGPGFERDPEFYASAIDGIADRTPDDGWRMRWITYAEALYETPLHLHYDGLDPHMAYRLDITYAGEDYAVPLTLTANDGVVLQKDFQRTQNPMQVTLSLPPSLTARGRLDLYWRRPDGLGGSGRGRQIAEVRLIPQP